MTNQVIVLDKLSDWNFEAGTAELVTADDYLSEARFLKQRDVQIINLCRSYRYLSTGYYCSLLAEARRHRPLPTVKTMLDLSSKAMYSLDAEDLDDMLHRKLHRGRKQVEAQSFTLDVFFGYCQISDFDDIARQIFELFSAPLLRVEFQKQERWRVNTIRSLNVNKLDEAQQAFFQDAFRRYQTKRWRSPRAKSVSRYDIAILINPQDPLPPSDTKALNQFIKAGKDLNVDVEVIEKKDFGRLAEYDALFIRDTTRINHYTYRFAKKAESEGMVVIDDPGSILRCTNKVYLAELLSSRRVPTLPTRILNSGNLKRASRDMSVPLVLKVPDGSFSRGVHKAETPAEVLEKGKRLIKDSDLILAQEFFFTEFDWRIGILNRKPIYACQYFMSKQHWQIVNYDEKGKATEGGFKAWRVEDVPPKVIEVALSAANLIGDGLYGVDLKQRGDQVYVIEVNDNPNLDSGVEDGVLGAELYRTVIGDFVRRLDQRHSRDAVGS